MGPLALVGSGEFLPGMAAVDRGLLEGRPGQVVVLPTAAAPEGDRRLDHWIGLAQAHFGALEVDVVPLLVRDRSDALRDSFAAALDGAGLVYLSGGDPAHLVETLRDTPVWEAVTAAWRRGAALAGCSAGAMALAASWPPFSDREWREFRPGLALVPDLAVVPHFDRVVRWRGGLPDGAGRHRPAGTSLVGIDEATALVWRPGGWRVEGAGGVWSLDDDLPRELPREGPVLPEPRCVPAG